MKPLKPKLGDQCNIMHSSPASENHPVVLGLCASSFFSQVLHECVNIQTCTLIHINYVFMCVCNNVSIIHPSQRFTHVGTTDYSD